MFGSVFTAATSAGVEALGTNVFVAASALGNGQKAFARFGRSAIERATTAHPVISRADCSSTRYISRFVHVRSESGSCGFESIRKTRITGESAHTKMAYILRI